MTVSRAKLVGVALVIFTLTVWLHWPSVHGKFVFGDDKEYLRQSVRWNGLTWDAVKWAFTSTESYYHPLVRLSHVLDYQIWRTNAAGHHATGLVLHALNAALVFGFLWTLLGATSLTTGERFMVALWVAVVFAIHPLQVESVAWMSGRTQLLCTTFGILSLWAYAAGARRWLVWGLYVAALLCKPMAVSLPFVMLAIDYYPLRRHEQLGWGRLVGEKTLWIALAVVASVATVITKSQLGQISTLATIPPSERVFLTFESLAFYPLKLVWPSHLSPVYPMQLLSLNQWPVLASVLTILITTAVAVVERRRRPMLIAAWGAYVVLILPVSGLMPIGFQSMAQRYAYEAMLPVLLLAGAAGIWVWRRRMTAARLALVGTIVAPLFCFAVRTRQLIPDWSTEERVRRAVLTVFPDSEQSNRAFAKMLLDQGRVGEALVYAQRAVELAPNQSYSHMTLGLVLGRLGRLPEAMAQDEQALQMNPDPAEGHYNFGAALAELGKVTEAAEQFEQAIRIKPDYPEAHYNYGAALDQMGRPQDAISHYEQALRLNPDYTEAHSNLGVALAQTGRIDEAIAHFEQALRLNPDFTAAHYNLGIALAETGRINEAIAHFEQALRLNPDYVEALYSLGEALEQSGRLTDAMERYQQALRIKPDFAAARTALARLQAGH